MSLKKRRTSSEKDMGLLIIFRAGAGLHLNLSSRLQVAPSVSYTKYLFFQQILPQKQHV